MRLISLKLNSLRDVYVHELRNLYSAETQIVDALPAMAKAATASDVRTAFQEHEQQTRGQVTRLERVFQELGEEPSGETSEGISALISEGKDFIGAEGDPFARDAALIGCAQKIEHFEIAGYGTARTHARQLGFQNQADLLQQTLDEEGQTDKRLTSIAERNVNVQASEPKTAATTT